MNDPKHRRYPVVFVFDDHFVQAASVAITSLINSRNEGTEYHIYIISPGFSEESKDILRKFECAPWNTEIRIIEIPTDKYASIYEQFDGNMGAGSITALLKFDIPQAVDEPVALYIDADVMVKKDLSELFSLDLTDYVAAVVRDSGKIYNKGGLRERIDGYFNSGVMLLNLDLMRSENYTEKLIQAKMSLDDIKLVDQDAFNIAFEGRTLIIPVKYNCLWINLTNSAGRFTMEEFNRFYRTNYSCLWDLEDDAYIIHFASKEKPWKYYDTPYAYRWMKLYDIGPCSHLRIERTNFFEKKPDISEIPIILATDANYTPQTGITILSALENRESDIPYRFFILTPELFDDDTMDKFHRIEETYGNCSIEVVLMGDAFKTMSMNIPHISFPTFYRLTAPELFPQYDKLIYMDSDVAVEGDLQEYYSIDLTGYYLGGVLAASFHWAPNGNRQYCEENGIPAIDQYINAGVILMNLAEMRRDHIQEKLLELVPLGLRCQDQDILNRVCYGRIRQIPYKYDAMIAKYEPVPEQNKKIFADSVINEGNNRPVITHYAAEIKPWASMSCALADRWWKYAMASPFFEVMRDRFYGKLIENGKNDRLNRVVGGGKPVFGVVERKKKVNTGYKEKMQRFDELWKQNDSSTYQEMYEICSSQMHLMNPQFIGRMARLYRDGKGVEKNLYKALWLMKSASDAGIRWARNEYVDILLMVNDEQSAAEAYEICIAGANKGDPFSQCRLARMYRDGKGVRRDRNEAIKWMREASKDNPGWVPELVKMLMDSDDPDIDSAIDYMRKTYSEKGAYRDRLVELLLKRGGEGDLAEIVDLCSHTGSEDPYILRTVAMRYRDGKGVQQDLDKAIELMGRAYGGNSRYAGDYAWLLLSSNNPENTSLAVEICNLHIGKGDAGAIHTMAMASYRGIGVDRDIDRAIGYQERICSKSDKYRKEYKEMLRARGGADDLRTIEMMGARHGDDRRQP